MKNGLQISVSGIRGIYPDFLTSEVANLFGLSFGSYVRKKKVFICRDTRVSGESLKQAVITGLLCTGKDVVDLGIAATPELAYVLEKIEKSPGVVITASHNPGEYNGIKFFSGEGIYLNSGEGAKLLNIYEKRAFTVAENPGFLSSAGYTEKYFGAVYNAVDIEKIKKRRFRVVVDVCQGVGALLTERFLAGMGCEAVIINKEPPGVFSHNPEPLAENLGGLSESVVSEKADIGFAQDPDGDRLAFVCEDGEIPGEEMTVVLCIKNFLEKKKSPVVVNLSTTSLVEETAKSFGVEVYRTKIGEINVVEGMKKNGSLIGGEGNGGIVCSDVHYGRDSFVGMALILEYIAKRRKRISEIAEELPKYFMLKKKVKIEGKDTSGIIEELKKEYASKDELNLEDGIKIIRRDGWIHIRPSGTEPVLRIYAEGKTEETAEKYLSEFTGRFG
ncbi:MAG: phosphoglucosamine mutase [Candidatus Omnitrophica bacterium]|nr:phosphoglucosamine mutase [Candidatus Omnitrophota bacterium]